METELKGLEFDPGFAPYILAFRETVDYLYMDINRFKNLSQKKMKFMQYYKKILMLFENNLGFYVGCIMWASYVKTQPKQKILSNHCFGKEYNKEDNISDTRFMLKFVESFQKDMKYYLGQNYQFDEKQIALLKVYEEFLILNDGFVKSEFNTDIKLPGLVNTENSENYKFQIEEVLTSGDLSKLLNYLPSIM